MSTIRKYEDVVSEVVVTSQDATYLVACPAATTATIEITLKEVVQAVLSDVVSLTFADNNPSDDTITRDNGSWIDDNFEAGMVITIAGTVSNNDSFLIADVTDKVITLDTAETLTDEVGVTPTSAVGDIADTYWFVHETVLADAHGFTYLENGPTGIRLKRASGVGTVRAWVRS